MRARRNAVRLRGLERGGAPLASGFCRFLWRGGAPLASGSCRSGASPPRFFRRVLVCGWRPALHALHWHRFPVPAPKKSGRGPLHRATPPLAVRRGQVDQIRSGSIAAIGWTCRQCGGSGTGGAVEGPPLGLFFRRAPGSGANGVLAERVSTRKPGPRKKVPAGRRPERQDPCSDRSTAPLSERQDPDASGAPPR